MTSTGSSSVARAAGLLILVASLVACGFMGTEVGNGAKDSKGGNDQDKKTASSGPDAEEMPTGTAAPDTGGDDSGQDDSMTPNEDSLDTSSPQIPVPTAGSNNDEKSSTSDSLADQPLALRVLGVSCASPLSQPLTRSLHWQEVTLDASDPLEVLASRSDDGVWTVSIPSSGDLLQVQQDSAEESELAVAVTTPEGDPIDQGFTCGKVTTDDNATLSGVSGTLQKTTVVLSRADDRYQVIWYRKAGASPDASTLERYEIEDLSTGLTIIMKALPPQ